MRNFTKLLFGLVIFFSPWLVTAQKTDTLEIHRDKRGEIFFARFSQEANGKMSNGNAFLKKVLNAQQNDEFRLYKESTDKYGIAHKRYQQYYKGIKVEGGEYLLHGEKGIIESINGNYREVNISSTSPSLTEDNALQKALAYVNAVKYKWEDSGMEQFIKQRTNNPKATYYPKGKLIIAQDAIEEKGVLKLAWRFTISSLDPDNEQGIYVDAQTGKIIGDTPLILDANTPGTAQTMYSGTQNIICDSYVGGFRLKENRNGVNIQTLNSQNSTNISNAVDFINSNTNWTSGNWAGFAQDQQALDAHWGAEKVFDYWHDVRGRNSIDNDGIDILSYVHYGDNRDNAYWNPTSQVMEYGDGSSLPPVVALDVCAHEFGHGINQFEADVGSGSGWDQSDALNEGLSDIWGAVIEHWAALTRMPG